MQIWPIPRSKPIRGVREPQLLPSACMVFVLTRQWQIQEFEKGVSSYRNVHAKILMPCLFPDGNPRGNGLVQCSAVRNLS